MACLGPVSNKGPRCPSSRSCQQCTAMGGLSSKTMSSCICAGCRRSAPAEGAHCLQAGSACREGCGASSCCQLPRCRTEGKQSPSVLLTTHGCAWGVGHEEAATCVTSDPTGAKLRAVLQGWRGRREQLQQRKSSWDSSFAWSACVLRCRPQQSNKDSVSFWVNMQALGPCA